MGHQAFPIIIVIRGPHVGEVAENIRIQYGGSMKADNAEALVSKKDIDGGLIGGAALKAGSFAELIANGIKGAQSK